MIQSAYDSITTLSLNHNYYVKNVKGESLHAYHHCVHYVHCNSISIQL